MEVFWDSGRARKDQNAVITVGTFDGVHLGHAFVIKSLIEQARDNRLTATVVTFEPHPKLVLRRPEEAPISILTTTAEKLELLQAFGLDRVVILKFTRDFSRMPSEEFLKALLFEQIGFKQIVIGYDHGFGRDRKGSIATAKAMSKELGFDVIELPKFETEIGDVSSSSIRKNLKAGDVEAAALALGREYALTGTVTPGEGRGKSLNYPTANLAITQKEKLVPGNGVYAVQVEVDGQYLQGMMNIGVRPTFNEGTPAVEVHIFDFGGDLYGKEVKIEFVARLRNEMRFDNAGQLAAQLDDDKKKCIDILSHVI